MRAQPENLGEKRMGAVFCQGNAALSPISRRLDCPMSSLHSWSSSSVAERGRAVLAGGGGRFIALLRIQAVFARLARSKRGGGRQV